MDWLDMFHSITNRIAVVILIVLVGFIIGRIVGQLVKRVLNEFNVDKLFKRKESVEDGVSQTVEYVIYIVTICIALDTLGILVYVLVGIAALIIIILVLSTLLGVKDFIPNFLCGLWFRKKYNIGNYINLGDVRGKIIKKTMLGINIQTKSKDIISVPNITVLKKKWK